MEAAHLVRAVQALHPPPEWATFPELPNGTGGRKTRTIDLFALNLWPSKGYQSLAFEVKVDRADFRRELDDPTKRAPWEALAHETWFVAPEGVIPVVEVPEGWGLLELRASGKWKRPRRALQRQPPEAWPRSFTAALARKSAPEPAPLEAWEVLGRKVTVDHLVKLAEALIRHRPELLDRRRTPPAREAWELDHQRRQAEHHQRVGELAGAVRRLCGRHVQDAATFAAWHAANARHAVPAEDRSLQAVQHAHRALGELLDELGIPRLDQPPTGRT